MTAPDDRGAPLPYLAPMETKAGDPGAFAHFDLSRVETPAFVVDAAKLRANCQILAEIRDEIDARAGIETG